VCDTHDTPTNPPSGMHTHIDPRMLTSRHSHIQRRDNLAGRPYVIENRHFTLRKEPCKNRALFRKRPDNSLIIATT